MNNFILFSLGSNIGNRQSNLKKAIDLIIIRLGLSNYKISPIYETEPVGYEEQCEFYNLAICGYTKLLPEAILDIIKKIEIEIGRQSREKWHEREIDIDIILYENLILNNIDLKIPHPEMHKRRFVLQPASDICSEALHPILGKTIGELNALLKDDKTVNKLNI